MQVISAKRSILWILCIALIVFLGYTALRLLMFNPYFMDFSTVSSKIYDRNGELLWEISEDNAVRNTPINIEDLPRACIDGMVAIEDKSFWVNNGVDQNGLARLALSFFTGGYGGGSTISQQLVKNAYLNIYNRDPLDKYFEILFALKMNLALTKEEILEKYLNNIYFGELNYGIESASESYFGKSTGELNISECAYLVGIPQWPGIYNPYGNIEKGIERRDQVLDAMYEEGYINESQLSESKSEDLRLNLVPSTIKAPHFVQFVGDSLYKKLGKEVYKSHTIETTYDYKLHQNTLSILKNYVGGNVDKNINNSAAVILDSEGNLLTMVGSVDFFNDEINGKFNSALGLRQPGTLFVPWIYSYALQNGYTLESVLPNSNLQLDINGKLVEITNPSGLVTPEKSLRDSINDVIPATNLLIDIGIEEVRKSLSESINFYPGGLKCEVSMVQEGCEISLLDLTNIYAGNFNQSESFNFLRTIDSQQSTLGKYSLKNIAGSNEIKNLLEQSDTGWLVVSGSVANKKDLFAIAFNQNYTVGVWSGNTKGEVLKIYNTDSNIEALNQIINSLNQ